MPGTAFATLLAVVCGLIKASSASDDTVVWDYAKDGPSTWPGLCQSGRAQSPINIDPAVVVVDTDMPPITYHGYDKPFDWEVKEAGLYVDKKSEKLGISGGGLNGFYELIQFHFHWGADMLRGSEHTVGGNHYAAEIHLVHSKDGYNAHEALSKPDGLAVVGVLVNVVAVNDSDVLMPLFTHMADLGATGIKVKYAARKLLPKNADRFYRYQGSLTTPKCNETVTWTVLSEPIFMSQMEYDELIRGITVDGKKLHETAFRPVQPLNGRKVTLRSDKIEIKKNGATERNLVDSYIVLTLLLSALFAVYSQ